MLETLVDRGTVEAAADPVAAQQGHQQGGFGVALPVAVGQYRRSREVVGSVVPEGDLVANEVVDRPDPGGLGQVRPTEVSAERPQSWMVEVQQRGGPEMGIVHPVEPTDRETRCGEALPGGTLS